MSILFEVLYSPASGSIYIGTEAELEEDETDALEKTVKDRKPHKTAIQVDVEQQNPESAPPATPLRFGRYNKHILYFDWKL